MFVPEFMPDEDRLVQVVTRLEKSSIRLEMFSAFILLASFFNAVILLASLTQTYPPIFRIITLTIPTVGMTIIVILFVYLRTRHL